MKSHVLSVLALAALAVACPAVAAPATAEQAPAKAPYSVETTPLGVLIDNAETKAILDREIPGLTTHSNIAAAREMTLRFVQPYAADLLTDERLAKVEAALKALDAKK